MMSLGLYVSVQDEIKDQRVYMTDFLYLQGCDF